MPVNNNFFCGRLTQCYCQHEGAGPCSPWRTRCTTCQLPRSRSVSVTPVGQCHRGARAHQSSRCCRHCHQLLLLKRRMQPPTRSHRSGTNVAVRRQCQQNTSTTGEICQSRRGDLAEDCALISCRTCQHTIACVYCTPVRRVMINTSVFLSRIQHSDLVKIYWKTQTSIIRSFEEQSDKNDLPAQCPLST